MKCFVFIFGVLVVAARARAAPLESEATPEELNKITELEPNKLKEVQALEKHADVEEHSKNVPVDEIKLALTEQMHPQLLDDSNRHLLLLRYRLTDFIEMLNQHILGEDIEENHDDDEEVKEDDVIKK